MAKTKKKAIEIRVEQVRNVMIEQRSDAWHAWRAGRYTASQAPSVMAVNPWFPKTPLQLYRLRTGQQSVFVHQAMRDGEAFEGRALELICQSVKRVGFAPACFEAEVEGMPWGASYDALLPDGSEAIEIKTPGSGSASELWGASEIPAHYRYQMIHQLLVLPSLQKVALAVYAKDIDEVRVLGCVTRDDVEEALALVAAWKAFDDSVCDLRPPPATDGDVVELDESDEEYQRAAVEWKVAKFALDSAMAELERAKDALLELAQSRGAGAPVKGCGVSIFSSTRAGNVNWKAKEIVAALAAANINTDDFRGKASTFWTVKEVG